MNQNLKLLDNKPLIFLGSNIVMQKFTEVCEDNGIQVLGLIDNDYWGNTSSICGVPVIDTEECFNDPIKLQFYKNNFNFFCATNWLPFQDEVSIRNRLKRERLLNLIDSLELNCINIIDKSARVSRSAKLGKGIFIDGAVSIEPNVVIQNYTNIYSHTDIGHDSIVGRNCVIQRHSGLASKCIMEEEVFFGTAVKALKEGATFGCNSFIQECIYLRRGTVANEVVSLTEGNLKRVKAGFQPVE